MLFRVVVALCFLLALAAAQNCGSASNWPFGCVSTTATYSDPDSTDISLTCYKGRPNCNNIAPVTVCPCPGSDNYLQAKASDPPQYPMQIRWGCGQSSDGCSNLKSGFGFRPALGTPVKPPGELFFFGLVAHLNYVITGGAMKSWTMNMKVNLLLPGTTVPQVSTFSMSLALEETLNVDPCGDTCKGTLYWQQNQGALVRPESDCRSCGISGGLYIFRSGGCTAGTHPRCCPFRTSGDPCSDRVRTLSSFSTTSDPFIINGKQYQVYLAGFSVPGSNGQTPRTFFISQESQATEAELWGKLVLQCPPTGTCTGDYVLNAAGDACTCDCGTKTCPAGQTLSSSCECVCNERPCSRSAKVNGVCQYTCLDCCPGNQIATGSTCACTCPNSCTAPKILDGSTQCNCVCPPIPCSVSGQNINPNTCQCECPACTGGLESYVDNGQCKCRCPASSCTAPLVLKDNDPSCGCRCPTNCASPKIQNPTTCECSCPPNNGCTSPKVADPAASSTCGCKCPDCSNPNYVVIDQTQCTCGCPRPSACTAPKTVQNPTTCACSCPACPGNQQLNTNTCACTCPVCPGNTVQIGSGGNCQCGCPACPGKQVVDPNSGNQCSCVCPDSACTGGLVGIDAQSANCECRCPDGLCTSPKLPTFTGNATAFSQCGCACPANSCPGSGLVPGSDSCACKCPTNFCGAGSLVDPDAPVGSCSCTCPACPTTTFDQSAQCACTCPLNQAACTARNNATHEYTFNATTCSCTCSRVGGGTCGCACTPQTADCFTVSATCNSADLCPRVFAPAGKNCSGTNNACVQNKCTATGTCQTINTNCAPTLAAVAATHRVCYGVRCDNAAGCLLDFSAGGTCSLDLTGSFGSDAQCYVSRCVPGTVAGAPSAGGCSPVFLPDRQCNYDWAGNGYTAADQKCNVARCVDDGCRPVGSTTPACVLTPAELATKVGSAADAMCFTSECQLEAGTDRTICAPKFDDSFSCTLDLAAEYGADNAQCFTVACDATQGAMGGCKATFHDGQPCVLAELSDDAADAQCFSAMCSQNQCLPVFDGARTCARNLTAEYGAVAAQCFSNACVDGACADVFADGAECTLETLAADAIDAQCFVAVCDATAQTCVPKFDATLPCVRGDLDVCHTSACENNACVRVLDASRQCSVNSSVLDPVCFRSGCTEQGCRYLFDDAQAGLDCPLDIAVDEASLVCYSSVCVAPNGCTAVFHANASCELNLTAVVGANNATCFTSQCTDGGCKAVFNPNGYCFEGTGTVSGASACYYATCSPAANGCVWVAAPDAACSDDNLCTVDPTLLDPITGSPSDRCVADSTTGSMTCVGSVSPCVSEYENKKNTTFYDCVMEAELASGRAATENQIKACTKKVEKAYPDDCVFKCFADVTGQFCIDPCGVPASKSKSDRAAIIAGVVVGVSACLFAMAALVFGYVKWGHQRLMNLLHNSDFGNNATMDNAIYDNQFGAQSNPIAE